MTGRKLTRKRDTTRPPQNPEVGKLWYDEMLGRTRRWNGKEWEDTKPGDIARERK